MITFTFNKTDTLTDQLYSHIKENIINHTLKENEKLPSKRALAKHLSISTITVENAYLQLLAEGYIYSKPRSGYYVAKVNIQPLKKKKDYLPPVKKEELMIDFSSNQTSPDHFPFTTWAKISRHVLSTEHQELLEKMPMNGVWKLRQAIADHLLSFRNIDVSPEQIIIGAGSEYLYSLLVPFFGLDKTYGMESPGYATISHVFDEYNVSSVKVPLDHEGIDIRALNQSSVSIIHVTPSHHFPTGITMSINRRGELLSWAARNPSRYIIEDEYDSEFRMMGKPLPSLFSIDPSDRVIYLNTFTKSLSSTIRIAYMILPIPLVQSFNRKFSFLNCSVSSFEQQILAEFIGEGYFEKHINRMRTIYKHQRDAVLDIFTHHKLSSIAHISEENAGLHFLLTIDLDIDVEKFKKDLLKKSIKLKSISDYSGPSSPTFIINYSSLDLTKLSEAFDIMYTLLQ